MKIEEHLKNVELRTAVLFIDDEENVLRAIMRTLRDESFPIFRAQSWEEAQVILKENDVGVVVCDRNLLGENSGIQILEEMRESYPKIVRIMLTGDTETHTLLSSINRGQVYRFIAKPWKSENLISAVSEGLELYHLRSDKDRFEKELIGLNRKLEDRIKLATQRVESLYGELDESFDQTINVLLSILELHSSLCVAHVKRTAVRVRALARTLGCPPEKIKILQRAALLHWIGLTSVESTFFDTHLWNIPKSEKPIWEFHALLGRQALLPILNLKIESEIIEHYLRPDLAPEYIQLDCQILAASSFFEHAIPIIRQGRKKLDKRELDALHIRFNEHYYFLDPSVVAHLFIAGKPSSRERAESRCELSGLKKGMVLSRPISTQHGIPIAPAEIKVDGELIQTLQEYGGELSEVFIWDETTNS